MKAKGSQDPLRKKPAEVENQQLPLLVFCSLLISERLQEERRQGSTPGELIGSGEPHLAQQLQVGIFWHEERNFSSAHIIVV